MGDDGRGTGLMDALVKLFLVLFVVAVIGFGFLVGICGLKVF
ncbi:MAG: hypothetical protein ABUT39_25065 [Acidobacteriota bacterium]